MSKDFVNDIFKMHEKYKVHDAIKDFSLGKHWQNLEFRKNFIKEEFHELSEAVETKNSEEVVDALIDIIVVAIGTLDMMKVDAYKAWDEVLKANMNKEVGIKASRPNPLGLPDLIKPAGWVGPSHENNHGVFND